MSRRRLLLLAIGVTEAARALVLAFAAIIFLAVVGLAFLTSTQVSEGRAHALVVVLVGVFALPYAAFILQLFGGLRRAPFSQRAARIDRRAGASLYRTVDEIAASVGISPPRSIWVSSGFELSCAASGKRYDVVFGLALLDVLDAAEFRAAAALLLARSFGGDRLTGRAYRSMLRWFDVLVGPAGKSAAVGLAKLTALRCVEMLGPESIVAERERWARSEARRVAGDTNVSAALLRPSAYDSYSTDLFWPGLLARHRSNVEPPDGVSQHRAICRSRLPAEEWTRRLNRAAAELDLPSASLVDVTRESWTPASDSLLGPLAPALTQVFDAAWRASVATDWSSIRESAAKRVAELLNLERLAAERSLSAKEELRQLQLLAERAEPAEALRAYEVFLAAHPGDADAHLHAGNTALAARRPDVAIQLLEKAIELDPGHAAEATRLIAEELRAQGRESNAEPYWQRNRAALTELSAALEERLRAKSDKPLLPHGLAPHEVEAIADHLRRFPMIASATLARRDVTILPTVPCLALGVRFTRSWFWWNTEKVRTMLAAIADCPLPLQVIAQDAGAAKELSRPPAVEIYRVSPVGRREQLTRWGRRSQRVLIGIGGFFLLWAAIANRGCFPECWTHANAILYLVPLILAVNLLVMAGTPDTPGRRAVACIASLFFAGFLYTKGWTGLMPFTVVALARLPTGRRPLTWAAGMSIPAVLLGWLVAQV